MKVCASATRLRMPPESWCGWWSSKPFSPTRLIQSRAVASAWFFGTPRNSGPAITLPSTSRHGNTASCWNTNPTRRSTPSTGASNSVTSPACGFASPAISPSVVDLPQPVGPTMAKNSPGAIERSKSSSAERISPAGVTNRRATFLRATAVGEGTSMLFDFPVQFMLLDGIRHCERSEAIQSGACGTMDCFVASLLAMTRRSMRRVGFDDELRGVGFRQVDGLALHVGREARQHLEHRLRRALRHHAVGRVLCAAFAQALHIQVELAGVIILRHLLRDFLRRMRVHPFQRLDEHVDDLLRGLLVGFHPGAIHIEAGGGIIAAECRARRFRRAQVDADFG